MVIDDPQKWEGPKIIIISGNKAIFKFVHKKGPIMAACHLYDHLVFRFLVIFIVCFPHPQGNELIEEEDKHGHATVFLISKNIRDDQMNMADLKSKLQSGGLRAFVKKKVTITQLSINNYDLQTDKKETVFTVFTPPHTGFYKLEIFASRIPKTNGKINLPLVATFLVQVLNPRHP